MVLSSFPRAAFPGGMGAFGVQNLNIWAQSFSLFFSPEGVGGWSTRGCSVSSSQEDLTTCACNHTTNFAVLLQVYEVQVRRGSGDSHSLWRKTFLGGLRWNPGEKPWNVDLHLACTTLSTCPFPDPHLAFHPVPSLIRLPKS